MWIMDSGASKHVCLETDALVNLKPVKNAMETLQKIAWCQWFLQSTFYRLLVSLQNQEQF